MGVELSGAWGTSRDSTLPGMIFCLLSLFLPSRGQTLVTSHHPAKSPVPQVPALILEDAEQELLFPAAGLFGGQGLVWSTLTLIPLCPLSLSLSSPRLTSFCLWHTQAMAKAGKQISQMESSSQSWGWTTPALASLNKTWSVHPISHCLLPPQESELPARTT